MRNKIILFLSLWALILLPLNSLQADTENDLNIIAISPPYDKSCESRIDYFDNDSVNTHAYVLINNFNVRLRTDGKDYTSIILKSSNGYHFKSVTILVPAQEDVALWQAWIEKYKFRPQRLLPPN